MKFYINNKIIKVDRATLPKKIIGDNTNYLAEFFFDEEWEGLTKTVRFKHDDDYFDIILDQNNCCQVPGHILKSTRVKVGVFAGNLTVTDGAILKVNPSILEEDGFPLEPDPDVYAQIMERLDQVNPETTNYENLSNLPSINDVTLVGSLTSSDLGLQEDEEEISAASIYEIWNRIMNN